MANRKKSTKIKFQCSIFFDVETYYHIEENTIKDIKIYGIGTTYVNHLYETWPNRLESGELTPEFKSLYEQGEKNLKTFYGENCTSDFFTYLVDIIENNNHIKIIAHNISYDYHMILEEAIKWFKANKIKLRIKKCLLDDNKNIITATWEVKTANYKNYKSIHFVDTWRWNSIKLNTWCQALEIPTKPEFDPHKENMIFKDNIPYAYLNYEKKLTNFNYESEKKYLENDVLALIHVITSISQSKLLVIQAINNYINPITKEGYNVLEMFRNVLKAQNVIEAEELTTKELWPRLRFKIEKITTQGAFTKFCAELFRGKPFEHIEESRYELDSHSYDIQNLCFLGGFTSGNNHTTQILPEDNKTVEYYDINSMYPYIMSEKLPYGEMLYEKPEDFTEETYATWVYLKGTQYKWKDKYNVFDTTFLGKSFFQRSIMRNHLNSIYTSGEWMISKELLDVMCEMCDFIDIRITGFMYQKKDYIRKDYMRCLMDIKEQETDKFNEYCKLKGININTKEAKKLKARLFPKIQYCKDLANKSYGKGCEKAHLDTIIWDNKIKDKVNKYRQWINNYEEEGGDGIRSLPCLLTGLYVPSYGRTMVLKAAKAIIDEGHKFLYCDTDSMIVEVNPNAKKIKDIIDVNPSKTGAWKLEMKSNLFLYAGKRKKYYMDKTKFAHAGFKREFIENLTLEEVKTLYNTSNNVLIINGRTLKGFLQDSIFKRIIDRTHAEFNAGTPVTHLLYEYKNKYIMREINENDKKFINKRHMARWYGDNWVK